MAKIDPSEIRTGLTQRLVFIGSKHDCYRVAETLGIARHEADWIPQTRPSKIYGMTFDITPVLCGDLNFWDADTLQAVRRYFDDHDIRYLEVD